MCQINPLLFLYPLNHENGTCLDSRQGTSTPRLDCAHDNLIKVCVWFSIIKVVIYGGSEVDRPNLALDSFLRRGNRFYQYNTKNWDTVSLYERPGIFWAGLGPVQIDLKLHD